jgi:ankyrin repeat protein
VNSKGIENRTALHCAVFENKVESAQMLLRYGANVEAQTTHQRTVLHIACILAEEAMCQVLLKAGANVNVQDFEQNTPVHYATSQSIS